MTSKIPGRGALIVLLAAAPLIANCSEEAEAPDSGADAAAADAAAPDILAPDTAPAPDYLPGKAGLYGQRCVPGQGGACQAGLTCIKLSGQRSGMGYCARTCSKSSDCTGLIGASCAISSGSSKLCAFICDGDNPQCPGDLGCTYHPGVGAYFCTGDPAAVCGDGRLEAGEDCDGKQLDNLSCEAFGFTGGTLGCKACRFDTGGCAGTSKCKLPPRRCTDGKDCLKLEEMLPRAGGDGFKVYTLSKWGWLRRDTFDLVQYASAAVACVAPGSWPISMADGSAKDGTTPKDDKGNYRHPPGSHANGVDIDVAYYQLGAKDNDPRPVCDETDASNTKVNHCTGPPNKLDLTRSTLFLGKVFESGRIRVAGVDGKIGPLMIKEAEALHKKRLITSRALRVLKKRLRWEITNTGQGWYLSHHHHVHVSTIYLTYKTPKTGKTTVLPDPGLWLARTVQAQ